MLEILTAFVIIVVAIIATMYDNELQDFIDKIEEDLDG